jgi:phage baseplate assembly protein V
MEPRQIKQMISGALKGVRQALRGILVRAEGDKRVVIVQMEGLKGESFNDAEFFQQPGFRSVPLGGMQPIIVPLNGNSANSVVVAMSNGKLFITDLQPGEVAIFNENDGVANSVILRNGKVIDITCDVLNITATNAVNIQTAQMTVDASAGVQINTPTVTMSDNLDVGDSATVANLTQTGTLSVTSASAGASHMAGGLIADGEIKSEGKSLPHHTHGNVENGPGSTSQPQ